jgi:hypothetical protein
MRKTLLFGTVALIVLAVLFTGCQDPMNPDSMTTGEAIPSISGPGEVTATAYPGANLITWSLVKDAKSYTLYRQRSGGELITVTQQAKGNTEVDLYYLDAVSFDNQLVDGVDYTYTVVANSGQSTSGRATVGETVIFDGAASARVTATIPKRDEKVTELTAETIAAITPEVVQDDGAETLLVTWPQDNPALTYKVEYSLGKTNPFTIVSGASNNPYDLFEQAYYKTPLFGGANTLTITVLFNGETVYYKPTTVTKELAAYTLSTIAKPTNFSVTRNDDNTTAKVAWTAVAPAVKASDYKLFRAEIEGTLPDNEDDPLDPVTIVGDWTAVPLTAAQQNGLSIEVQDTGLGLDKQYAYVLYAQVGEAKSDPVAQKLDSTDEPLQDFTAEVVDDNKVTIAWPAKTGLTYTLARAAITEYPAYSISEYTPITIPATPSAGWYTVTDSPAIRKAYRYKLTVTSGSIVKTYSTDVDTGVFKDSADVSLSVNAHPTEAYATVISINNGTAIGEGDLFVDLYRATAKAGEDGWITGTETAAFAKITTIDLKADPTYEDTGLTPGQPYVYRIELRQGASAAAATAFTNTQSVQVNGQWEWVWISISEVSGYALKPSVPSNLTFSVTGTNILPNNGGTERYYKVTTGSNYVNARVRLEYRQVPMANVGNIDTAAWTSAGSETTVIYLSPTATLPTGYTGGVDSSYVKLTQPAPKATVYRQYRLVVVDDSEDPTTVEDFDSENWEGVY